MANDIREIKNKYLNTDLQEEDVVEEDTEFSNDTNKQIMVNGVTDKYKGDDTSSSTYSLSLIIIAVILIVGIIVCYIMNK